MSHRDDPIIRTFFGKDARRKANKTSRKYFYLGRDVTIFHKGKRWGIDAESTDLKKRG